MVLGMPLSEDHPYMPAVTTRDNLPAKLNPDASSLRGLAHPLRLRILEILRLEGPATATTLAERLGVRTGSTSWHLQKLAEHGFIDELPDRGTRRERWWSAPKILIQYAEAMEAGEDQALATTEYMTTGLDQDHARVVAFLHQDWDFDWRHAAIFNTYDQLVLDPETLVQLRTELWDLLSRYTQNPNTTPRARRVIFTMQAVPYEPDDGQPSHTNQTDAPSDGRRSH
jgi:DNA-binding transcriptional ArsR family regulator